MRKFLPVLALGLSITTAWPAYAFTIHTEDIASHGANFDKAVQTTAGTVLHDTWINPDWDVNDGTYQGTSATPFVFYGMHREGYSVEKGLIPLGISGRSIFLPMEEAGIPYPPLTLFSPLNGQAVTLNPDTQPVGGADIYPGFHPGIEYGLVFKFDQPIDAFGLEFNIEAHNGADEKTFASLYYALDGGPAQLVSGPHNLTASSNGVSVEMSSFIGIIEKGMSFSTITFFTDGPRDENGALLSFYNAYAGGTIHYSLAGVSPVPEVPMPWLLLPGLAALGWRVGRST